MDGECWAMKHIEQECCEETDGHIDPLIERETARGGKGRHGGGGRSE